MSSRWSMGWIISSACGLLVSAQLAGAQAPTASASTAGALRDRAATEQVLRGERTTANAAWWGFDPSDSTQAIQSAINSGAKKVIVPYVGAEWIVRPLRLASNQEIVFEPGVVVLAKKGEFHEIRDALLLGKQVKNVSIRGYGATLRMRKDDYLSPDYQRSEFRHALAFYACNEVRVLGLTLENSGGDGIYVGPIEEGSRPGCGDVLIRDCVCRDNYRQGMSVVSGRRVRIENCQFRNTRGTAPQAGLDLEPGSSRDSLSEIEVLNCRSEDNEGSAYVVNVMRLTPESEPVGVRFWNCLGRGTKHPGLRVMVDENTVPRGTIEFASCTVEYTEYAGLYCAWNPGGDLLVRFSDCKWSAVARKRTEFPVHVKLVGGGDRPGFGSLEFVNSYVFDDRSRRAIQFTGLVAELSSYGVSGELHVVNRQMEGEPSDSIPAKTTLNLRHHRE